MSLWQLLFDEKSVYAKETSWLVLWTMRRFFIWQDLMEHLWHDISSFEIRDSQSLWSWRTIYLFWMNNRIHHQLRKIAVHLVFRPMTVIDFIPKTNNKIYLWRIHTKEISLWRIHRQIWLKESAEPSVNWRNSISISDLKKIYPNLTQPTLSADDTP